MGATTADPIGLLPFAELLSRLRNVEVDALAAPAPDGPLLGALRADLAARLPAVAELVYGNDDYATYTPGQRRLLMEAAVLATTIASALRAGAPAPRRLVPRARRALRRQSPDEVLRRFAEVVAALGDRPVFATAAEFDAWMLDEDTFVFGG